MCQKRLPCKQEDDGSSPSIGFMSKEKVEILKILYEQGAIKFGKFRLKSSETGVTMVEKTYLVCDLCDKHELWTKDSDVLHKPIKNLQIFFESFDLCKECTLKIVKVLRDTLSVPFVKDYEKSFRD